MAVVTVGQSIVPKGKTIISTTQIAAGVSAFEILNISQIYKDLLIVWSDIRQTSAATSGLTSRVRFNSDSTSGAYKWAAAAPANSTLGNFGGSSTTGTSWGDSSHFAMSPFQGESADRGQWGQILIYDYASVGRKLIQGRYFSGTTIARNAIVTGTYDGQNITRIDVSALGVYTYNSGTVLLYGIV